MYGVEYRISHVSSCVANRALSLNKFTSLHTPFGGKTLTPHRVNAKKDLSTNALKYFHLALVVIKFTQNSVPDSSDWT